MISPEPPAGPARTTVTGAGTAPSARVVVDDVVDVATVVVDIDDVGVVVAGDVVVVADRVVVFVVVGCVDDESPHDVSASTTTHALLNLRSGRDDRCPTHRGIATTL